MAVAAGADAETSSRAFSMSHTACPDRRVDGTGRELGRVARCARIHLFVASSLEAISQEPGGGLLVCVRLRPVLVFL